MISQSINYFIKRFILRKDFLIANSNYKSISFKFKTEDCVGRSIYKHGVYEPEDTEFILENLDLHPKDIVLDIGANIGWYSLLLANKFQAKIFSFEPDPLNFNLLENNIEINDMQSIKAINKAASNSSKTHYLHQYKDSNLGRHSILPINTGNKIKVGAISLNDFVQNNLINVKLIKFIKIDIEGYEYTALQGASRILEHVPLIMSEFSPALMLGCNMNPNDYISFLTDFNYTPYTLKNGALEVIPIENLKNLKKGVINIYWKK